MTPTITINSARDAYWYAHTNFSNATKALRTHPDDPVLVDQLNMMLGAVSSAAARLSALESKQLNRPVAEPPVAEADLDILLATRRRLARSLP